MTTKTNKSARKRIKITGKNKMLRRAVRQNHFNAKDTGNEKRDKRGQKSMPKEFDKSLRELFPFEQ